MSKNNKKEPSIYEQVRQRVNEFNDWADANGIAPDYNKVKNPLSLDEQQVLMDQYWAKKAAENDTPAPPKP